MQIIESKKTDLENQATQIIEKIISDTLKKQDEFVLAVAGGGSVTGIFEKLAGAKINWQKVHIFLADERIVPNDSPDSNFKNLTDNLISKIEISSENIHNFDDNLSPEKSLEKYQTEFDKFDGRIDLILLSSGPDGHIASLFPQHPSIENESDGYILVENSPKPPANRYSLSKNAISKAKNAILLFFGPEKHDAFHDFNNPLLSERECPAQIVQKIENSYILRDE